MPLHGYANARPVKSAAVFVGVLAVAMMLVAPQAGAQTNPQTSQQESKPSDAGTASVHESAGETVQTFFLTNSSDSQAFNDIQTALRNFLPKAKIYGVQMQNAITIKATPEEMEVAQKLISDLDRSRKLYRLTYTITDIDGGKRLGSQQFTLLAFSGSRSMFKQGSRVPIVTGNFDGQVQHTEVQYQDIGLSIQADVNGSPDTISLRTKIEQSSLADERGVASAQDPVVRQNVLDESSELSQGKPLVLGSLDLPGTTRSQEIEVVAELVR